MAEKPKNKLFSHVTNAFVGLLSLVAPRSNAEPENDLMKFVKVVDAGSRDVAERTSAESAAANQRINTSYLARKIRETSKINQPSLAFSEKNIAPEAEQPIPVLNYQANFFDGVIKGRKPVQMVGGTDKPFAEPHEEGSIFGDALEPKTTKPVVNKPVVTRSESGLAFMPVTGELPKEANSTAFPELAFGTKTVTHEQVEGKPKLVPLPISEFALAPESAVIMQEPEAVAAGKTTYALARTTQEVAVEVVTEIGEELKAPRIGSGQETDVAFAMLYMEVSKLDPQKLLPVLGDEDCKILQNLWVIIIGEEACLLSPTSETVKALPAIRAKLAEPSIANALGQHTSEVLSDFLTMFETAKIVTEDPRPAVQNKFAESSVFALSAVEQANGRVLN